MALILPQVQPVALKLSSETSLLKSAAKVDVSNDYGTPNLLFLYYVPFLPDDKKLDLDAVRDEFQTWNAWELGQAEVQLNGHVDAGDLPSDDSVASRTIRNNYRSKVVQFFRETSQAWLSIAQQQKAQKIFETTQEGVNNSVHQGLKVLATENNLQGQFEVILNAVSGSVNMEQENKYYFTHVYYKYDTDSKRFLPVVSDTLFTIKKQNEEGKSTKDGFKIEINLYINFYKFDRKFWRDNRHEGEEAIKMGEPIRKQMALDLYVDS